MKETPDTPAELKTRALRYLMRREHSRTELARKLAPHAESSAVLQSVLDQLEERKQLSDQRYAETRAHVLSRKYGAARIRQDLKAHGVADAVAERFSAKEEVERAKAVVARKYRSPARTREEQAKRMRFLQGRGFSYDTIRAVLRIEDAE